ncbi:MAG: YegP family protein [Aquificae bacterium]|nr:YegP family protein [Aquificota bacterium]
MKVVLKRHKDKEKFSFVFVEGGKTILKSQMYASKRNAMTGINAVMKNSPLDRRYERKQSKDGRWYFNLKAANGKVVGTSPFFKSEEEMEDTIKLLKEKAYNAPIEYVEE